MGDSWAFLHQGNPDDNGCAVAGFAFDIKFSAQKAGPFFHAGKAEAWAAKVARRINADSVVADGQLETPIQSPEHYFDSGGAPVPNGIMERLLCDAVKSEGHVPRDRGRKIVKVHLNANRNLFRKTIAFRLQRLVQSKVNEGGGVQFIRNVVDILAEAHELVLNT